MQQEIFKSFHQTNSDPRFLAKLKRLLPWNKIAEGIMLSKEHQHLSKKQIVAISTQYVMFLSLIHLYPQQTLIPNVGIDLAWHEHILSDVDQYANNCHDLFGCVINHVVDPKSEHNAQAWQHSIWQTQNLFEKHYGIQIFTDASLNQPARCQPLRTKPSFYYVFYT
jgi:hypothetical protein